MLHERKREGKKKKERVSLKKVDRCIERKGEVEEKRREKKIIHASVSKENASICIYIDRSSKILQYKLTFKRT